MSVNLTRRALLARTAMAGAGAAIAPLLAPARAFAAPQGGERTLFELAYELEAAAPWAARWPGIA